MLGIDTVFGLPVHVLMVHFAVVLVPLAAAALIVTGWKPEWRQRYALAIAIVAIAGAGAAMVSAQSGETLQRTIERDAAASGQTFAVGREGESELLGDHPEQGNTAEVVAIVFGAAATGLFVLEQWGPRFMTLTWHANAAYLACCVLGVFALVTMVAAGHSGATLVWKDLGNFVQRG
jgi:Predicted membrane protein (DUF2231)